MSDTVIGCIAAIVVALTGPTSTGPASADSEATDTGTAGSGNTGSSVYWLAARGSLRVSVALAQPVTEVLACAVPARARRP